VVSMTDTTGNVAVLMQDMLLKCPFRVRRLVRSAVTAT
jgi:hypothetical protein